MQGHSVESEYCEIGYQSMDVTDCFLVLSHRKCILGACAMNNVGYANIVSSVNNMNLRVAL